MPWGDVGNGTASAPGTPSKGGWGSIGNQAIAPEHHASSGGGLFGFAKKVGHYVGQKADLAARDIKAMPAGLLQVAEAPVLDTVQGVKDLPTNVGTILGLNHKNLAEQHGGHTLKMVEGLAKSSEQTLEHPLRDPFATALTVAPLGHGLARAAVGATDATAAIARGEGVKAATEKALTRPEAKPRVITAGDKQMSLIPSKNAAVRAVQSGYDQLIQNALDRNPRGRLAAHAQKRIGGALDEEGRIQGRMRLAKAQLLDQAATKLLRAKTPATRRMRQAALELTSTQTTPQEAAAFHLKQAADGVNPGRNKRVADLYQRVADANLVHVDEAKPAGEKVYINPEHARLAQVDARLAAVQRQGDQALAEKGVRTPEQLQARTDAPARIRAGATFQHDTLAGVDQPERFINRNVRGRLDTKSGTVLAPGKVEGVNADGTITVRFYRRRNPGSAAGSFTRALAPGDVLLKKGRIVGGQSLSPEAAKARLAELDRTYEQALQTVAPEVNPYTPEQTQIETRSRNTMRGRMAQGKKPATGRAVEGRIGGGSKTIKTVSQEVRDLAETKLLDMIAKHPSNATLGRLSKLIAERDQLRARLNAQSEAAFAGERAATLPTEHGLEPARPGRGFVSFRGSEKRLSRVEHASSRGPVVGAAQSPIDSKTFTGRSIEHGLVPKDVTGGASRHLRRIIRFVNTDERRRAALATGSDVKRSERDVLVRNPDATPAEFNAEIRQALGREKSTVDTDQELASDAGLEAAFHLWRQHLVPGLRDSFSGDRSAALGTPAPDGFKWVDHGALGDLAAPVRGPASKLGRAVDSVNSAITALTVYFKIGHVGTRALTNAATNIIQGSMRPRELGQSADLWHSLTDEEKARALAASGQHGMNALPHEGANLVAAIAGKGASWWARHFDAPFRFNSLAYELRHAGYGTTEQFTRALDALESGGQGLPAHEWSKVSAAARRADREAISYDRLNSWEKQYLARGVWFYPWVKGSTLFTIQTMLEHPVKAALLGQSGVQGREQQLQELGPVPSYEGGLIALGHGQSPVTTDLSTFSPFATAGDVLKETTTPGGVAGFLNPALAAAAMGAEGLNQYGGASTSYLDALQALAASTPEQQLFEAYQAQQGDQGSRIFPKTVAGTVARFLGGPATPRRANRSGLAKAAARETSGRR